jgi:hypothetical protein
VFEPGGMGYRKEPRGGFVLIADAAGDAKARQSYRFGAVSTFAWEGAVAFCASHSFQRSN